MKALWLAVFWMTTTLGHAAAQPEKEKTEEHLDEHGHEKKGGKLKRRIRDAMRTLGETETP